MPTENGTLRRSIAVFPGVNLGTLPVILELGREPCILAQMLVYFIYRAYWCPQSRVDRRTWRYAEFP